MPPKQNFQLRILEPIGPEPAALLLGDEESTIGRNDDNALVLHDLGIQLISRYHASIKWEKDAHYITDLGSANGTLLDGTKIHANEATRLPDGVIITIGERRLVYERISASESSPQHADESNQDAASFSIFSQPPQPPAAPLSSTSPYDGAVPPGLSLFSERLIYHLPEIYHPQTNPQWSAEQVREHSAYPNTTDHFFIRFLAIFESILLPIEWTVDGFETYLSPSLAPEPYLTWLESWFEPLVEPRFDPNWTLDKRRRLIAKAEWLFARRGTKAAMRQLLAIYIDRDADYVEIMDVEQKGKPMPDHTFFVYLPKSAEDQRKYIEALINAHKPAHTSYQLFFRGR